jgi:hypothetical protein
MTLALADRIWGGAEEDTDGGFLRGGWSMPFFDPDVMGPAMGEMVERTDALLYGRRTGRVRRAMPPRRASSSSAIR